ncbi:MAG: VOC family protein [Candidatus Eremiobacteraeota bacterium]|nr:VOC family protein [Candidatus Eremiobacteraeota bacterium]
MKVALGAVGHFGLSVRDPEASAMWWRSLFDLRESFSGEDYIGLSNDRVTIVLHEGVPHPGVLGHMSFHVADMRHLRAALKTMRDAGVRLEDPGDEIGPEAPGSPNLGLWFHDPDGYRWELSVQNGAREA